MSQTINGFDYAASCRRVWGTYRREPVDRVPMLPPIGWRVGTDLDVEYGDWRDEERYRRVARLVQQHCDLRPPFNVVGYPRVWAPQSYQRFLEAPQEYVEELPPEKLSDVRTRHTTVLHTPKGDLKWVFDIDKGIFTWWDIQRPVNSIEDA